MSWTVLLPVKRLDVAKSRLRGAVPGVDHEALVLAMAMDTLTAIRASPVVGRVVVVHSDPLVARAAVELGGEAVPDVPDAGLNPALAYAATLVRPRGATARPGVVAVPADLPALRTDDLTAALRAASATRAPRTFVADAARTGTVLLAARPDAGLEPCFGGGSAAAHVASGAVALTGGWPSLRRDVDTIADLVDAIRCGLGPRTWALIGPAVRAGALGPTVGPTLDPAPGPTLGPGLDRDNEPAAGRTGEQASAGADRSGG